jgi:hypothetical protein
MKGGNKMKCKNTIPINEKIVRTLPKKGIKIKQPFKKKVKIKPFC